MKSPAKSIFLLAALSRTVFPQAFTANLTGLVTDPAQSAVPSAIVKVVNLSTRETRQTSTSVEGRYVFSQLLPGSYGITVEAAGFKTTTNTGLYNHAGSFKTELSGKTIGCSS